MGAAEIAGTVPTPGDGTDGGGSSAAISHRSRAGSAGADIVLMTETDRGGDWSTAAARSTCIGTGLGTAGVATVGVGGDDVAKPASTPGGGREGIGTFGVVPDTRWPFGLAFIRICDVARPASDAFAAAGWPVV